MQFEKRMYYVNHPAGREHFGHDELTQANIFAQRLANETGRPIARRHAQTGHAQRWFYPAFGYKDGKTEADTVCGCAQCKD